MSGLSFQVWLNRTVSIMVGNGVQVPGWMTIAGIAERRWALPWGKLATRQCEANMNAELRAAGVGLIGLALLMVVLPIGVAAGQNDHGNREAELACQVRVAGFGADGLVRRMGEDSGGWTIMSSCPGATRGRMCFGDTSGISASGSRRG